jgi:hypothetical protein
VGDGVLRIYFDPNASIKEVFYLFEVYLFKFGSMN